jgi:transcriptional regulator with XRE-family HTH domain
VRHPDQLWIAAKVRSSRIRKKLTQGQLARALGKPQSFVSKLETAERRLDFLEAIRLAQVLTVDLLELVPPASLTEKRGGNRGKSHNRS